MTTKQITKVFLGFLVVFLFNPLYLTSQERSYPQTIFEQLTEEEGAKIILETDMTSILTDRRTKEYTPAILTTADGKSYAVKVLPKGKFRRKIATVPPLKIKFPKKTLEAAGLDTLNEMKLVLPCFDTRDGDELILKEYVIYQMFERLTSACVRGRLVQVELRDNHAGQPSMNMFGILVEDNEETAARLKGLELDQYGLPMDSMVLSQAALVALFEYMVGNTDWDLSMLRNVRLIRPHGSDRALIVPYDFDFSGFVSAPYASPASESGLETVLDRFLMANGIPKEDLRRAAQALKSAQKDLYDLCYNKYLTKNTSRTMQGYLDSFFDNIDKNNDVPVKMNYPNSR
jgi:hypothetical protein